MRLRSVVLTTVWLSIYIAVNHVQTGFHQMTSIPSLNNELNPTQFASHHIEYKFRGCNRGITKGGITYSHNNFISSDGKVIHLRIEFLHADDEVKAQLEAKIKGYSEIIETTALSNKNGEVVGERIVGKQSMGEGKAKYCITWSHGRVISNIESDSLEHALDFEMWYYKHQK